MKRAFISYDLGDAETITDIIIVDYRNRNGFNIPFIPMMMPFSKCRGQAIPTAFAIDEKGNVVFASSILDDPTVYQQICVNFKRRPSDMFRKTSVDRTSEIIKLFEQEWPSRNQIPEVNYDALNQFLFSVVTFTNAIFNNEEYLSQVRNIINLCDSIIFCAGYPTSWSKLDVAIYEAMLNQSILGSGSYTEIPSKICFYDTTRAAFLYVKDRTGATVLPQGKAALLIDVGSSTIDITATTADSRNHLYNSGNNYLGVCCIDFIIRDWYLKKLKEDPDDWEVYQELLRRNPTMKMALALSCRKAKEEAFSVAAKKARIVFAEFAPVRITQDNIIDLVKRYPIVNVLKDSVGIPEDVASALGNKTWIQLFREFVTDQKKALETQHISVGRIILTGSASKMPFVKEIVSDVFSDLGEDGVLSDLNPSRSISMGLAISGVYDEKPSIIYDFIANSIPECVKHNIGNLGESLSQMFEKKFFSIITNRIHQWKECNFTTLNDMIIAIKNDCSEQIYFHDCICVIHNWLVEKVGADIAIELKALCEKFGLSNITIRQLDIFDIFNQLDIFTYCVDPTEDRNYEIKNIEYLIASQYIDFIIANMDSMLDEIENNVANNILNLLLAIPSAGHLLLSIICGNIIHSYIVQPNQETLKREVLKKIGFHNLPLWVRRLVPDDKIESFVTSSVTEINASIQSSDIPEKLQNEIEKTINLLLEHTIQSIEYMIP